jgi:hypothetical protein
MYLNLLSKFCSPSRKIGTSIPGERWESLYYYYSTLTYSLLMIQVVLCPIRSVSKTFFDSYSLDSFDTSSYS